MQVQTPQQPLTVQETAEFLNLSKNTTRKLINQGDLRCVRAGKRLLVPMEAIHEYLNPNN